MFIDLQVGVRFGGASAVSKGPLMTKDPRHPRALGPRFTGQTLDRDAARRASAMLEKLPEVLPADSVSLLAREVIARLAARGDKPHSDLTLAQDLAEALISRDDGAALRRASRAVSAGTSVEDMYVLYLSEAARILGEKWAADHLASAQITIAAARIYALIRGLSASIVPSGWQDERHAIFATVPGEQHTLGVTMAADLFRRDGWVIDLKVGRDHEELLHELAETDFAVLGLSVCTASVLPDLIRLIAAVRISDPHARIVVSGHLADTEPQLGQVTGADYVSTKLDTLRVVMRDLHDTIAAQPEAAQG